MSITTIAKPDPDFPGLSPQTAHEVLEDLASALGGPDTDTFIKKELRPDVRSIRKNYQSACEAAHTSPKLSEVRNPLVSLEKHIPQCIADLEEALRPPIIMFIETTATDSHQPGTSASTTRSCIFREKAQASLDALKSLWTHVEEQRSFYQRLTSERGNPPAYQKLHNAPKTQLASWCLDLVLKHGGPVTDEGLIKIGRLVYRLCTGEQPKRSMDHPCRTVATAYLKQLSAR